MKLNNWKKLIPDEQKMISYEEVEKELSANGFPITIRTLRYYVTEGVINKPFYIRREAKFKRDYIIPVAICVYILKTHFSCSLADIREVLLKTPLKIEDLLDKLQLLVEEYLDGVERRPYFSFYKEVLVAVLKLGRAGELKDAAMSELEEYAEEKFEDYVHENIAPEDLVPDILKKRPA